MWGGWRVALPTRSDKVAVVRPRRCPVGRRRPLRTRPPDSERHHRCRRTSTLSRGPQASAPHAPARLGTTPSLSYDLEFVARAAGVRSTHPCPTRNDTIAVVRPRRCRAGRRRPLHTPMPDSERHRRCRTTSTMSEHAHAHADTAPVERLVRRRTMPTHQIRPHDPTRRTSNDTCRVARCGRTLRAVGPTTHRTGGSVPGRHGPPGRWAVADQASGLGASSWVATMRGASDMKRRTSRSTMMSDGRNGRDRKSPSSEVSRESAT